MEENYEEIINRYADAHGNERGGLCGRRIRKRRRSASDWGSYLQI